MALLTCFRFVGILNVVTSCVFDLVSIGFELA